MTQLPSRFRPLLRPLFIAGMLVAAGAACLAISLQWHATARQTNTAAEARLSQLEARYQQSRETNRLTNEALKSWAHYLRAGLSTTPDRVGWIDSIQTLGALPGTAITDYELGPDVALNEPPGNTLPALIGLTPLHLQATVAHEERFIGLLEAIRKAGQVSIRQCSLATRKEGDDNTHLRSLEVDCRLVLVMLHAQ